MVIVILGNFTVEEKMFGLFSNAVMLVLGFFFGKVQNQEGK
jgi:hypothetical protein